MYNLAMRSKEKDRKTLFSNVADKMGLNTAIIEKDFWVCLILDYLFNKCEWKGNLTFKGGTSLSKCFNMIHRFSEDIDLILDWRVLGYSTEEVWQDFPSINKQNNFNKAINNKTKDFLETEFIPKVKKDLSDYLKQEIKIEINKDEVAIDFFYPKIFTTSYILPVIKLEIGALAAWSPANEMRIKSYAVQFYPEIFKLAETKVLTAAVERTFWEKATILHHEANRPENSPLPLRYSRHYYDLYCIAISDIKGKIFGNLELLSDVVEFKSKFYPRAWAKYEEAKIGTLKLVPPKYRFKELKKDYENMLEMMFYHAKVPSFELIIDEIKKLEEEINGLK